MFYRKKRNVSLIQVGICKTVHQQVEAVWLDKQRQPHFLLTDIGNISALPQQIAARQPDFEGRLKLKFITAVSPHKIWSKTLILPQQLNAQECEQQCRFVLQNELPVPFEELWFDYCSTPLKQGLRLDIFAIIQSAAQAHLAQFSPLHIDVLDNAAHCLLRAFRYFTTDIPSISPLFLYQDETNGIALQNKPHQLQLIQQTAQNPTALLAQYSERYAENIEQVICYNSSKTQHDLPENWQTVETDIPFLALGAALWQQDLIQDEKAN